MASRLPLLAPRPAAQRCCTRRGGGGGRVVSAAASLPPGPAPNNDDGEGEGKTAMPARQRLPQQRPRQEPASQRDWQPRSSGGSGGGQQQQQQEGMWPTQPRGGQPASLGSFYPRRQLPQPTRRQQQQQQQWRRDDATYGSDLSGSGYGSDLSDDDSFYAEGSFTEEEDGMTWGQGGLQQQRQRRQHALRSLRQDLRAARSASPAPGLVGDAESGTDFEAQQGGGLAEGITSSRSGGTAGRQAASRELRTAARTAARWRGGSGSSSSNSIGSGGMVPEGHFLRCLQESGVVDEAGRPTELGRRQGVGFSSYMNVGINKLLAQSTDLATIFCIVRDVGYLMDAINASTAMHRLGKVVRRQRERDPDVVSAVVQHPLYLQLLGRVEELAPKSQPRALANTMWGLAALGDVEHVGVAAALADAVVGHPVELFQPQELSNIVWALGTLGLLHTACVDHVLSGVTAQIGNFIPQALSNMVWACAHLRNGTRGCLGPTAGGGPSTTVARDARPGWQPPPAFLEAVAAASTRLMQDFQSQSMSNLLWGFCKLDVYPQQLFEAAAAELVERFRTPEMARQFRAQELSNSLYAFAQGNIINEQLLSAYERELSASWLEIDGSGRERRVSRLDDFTSQALANTLWSFANLRWYPVRLLEPITRAVGRKLSQMSPQEISNSIWSYAKFAYHPGPVMALYQVEVGRRVPQFSGQSLTTTLWAMSALSATHCEGFVALVDRFVELEREGSFQEVQYNQVLQAVLLAQFEMQRAPGEFRAEIDLPDDIVDRALLAWQQQQQAAKLSSFQLEVSDALGALGIEHELEHLTAVNLLSVDIAIVKGGRKIAIEVDGPFHFSVNTNSALGQTMIRRRLLRAVGWTVISVPYHTWYKLPAEQRTSYLSRLLVRKDGSFHDQIMRVSEDLLSPEFKRGLGSEAGADAIREDSEAEGGATSAGSGGATSSSSLSSAIAAAGAAGPASQQQRQQQWQQGMAAAGAAAAGEQAGGGVGARPARPGRLVPRNLGELLEREGLMLTKSAARRLVDMGFAEQVPGKERPDGGDGPATFHARRREGTAGSTNAAGSSSSGSSAAGLASLGGSFDEAAGAAASGEEGGSSTALDAILEAARLGDRGGGGAEDAGGGAEEEGGWAQPGSQQQEAQQQQAQQEQGLLSAEGVAPPRALQVDHVDIENPLRPRYTDFSGNVLEGSEPYNLGIPPQPSVWRRAAAQQQQDAQQAPAPPPPPQQQQPASSLRPPERRNPMARPPPSPEAVQQQQQAQQQQQQAQHGWPASRQGLGPSAAAAGGLPPPKSAARPTRQGPPLPQGRQDLRPWQVGGSREGRPSPQGPAGMAPGKQGGPAASAAAAAAAAAAARQAAQRRVLASSPPPARQQAEALQRKQQAPQAGANVGATPGPPPPAAATSAPAGSSHVVQLASKLTLAELRRLCESKGLPSWGTKAQLASRLVAHSQDGG